MKMSQCRPVVLARLPVTATTYPESELTPRSPGSRVGDNLSEVSGWEEQR